MGGAGVAEVGSMYVRKRGGVRKSTCPVSIISNLGLVSKEKADKSKIGYAQKKQKKEKGKNHCAGVRQKC